MARLPEKPTNSSSRRTRAGSAEMNCAWAGGQRARNWSVNDVNLVGHPCRLVLFVASPIFSQHFGNLLEKWTVASCYFVIGVGGMVCVCEGGEGR